MITQGAGRTVARSAESLVFGVDGPVVVVSARAATVLMERAGLTTYRRDHRGKDSEVDATLVALTLAAAEYRNRLSGNGHQVAPTTATPASCALTTADAAARLGCGQRTITRAIAGGQLPARKVGRQWFIDADDFQHYANQHA